MTDDLLTALGTATNEEKPGHILLWNKCPAFLLIIPTASQQFLQHFELIMKFVKISLIN